MNYWIKSTLLAAGIAASFGAFAQSRYDNDRYDDRHDNRNDDRYSHWDYDDDAYGRVVSVNAIVDRDSRPVSRRVCRVREGRQQYANNGWGDGYYYDGRYRYDSRSNTPAVLGAIIGGLLGNQVGDGNGRTAATIAGAALGATVGRDQQNRGDRNDRNDGNERYYGNGDYDGRNYQGRRYAGRWAPHTVEQCRTVTRQRNRDRVVAYDVTYEYNNRLYQTTTNYNPGRQIRVRVDAG